MGTLGTLFVHSWSIWEAFWELRALSGGPLSDDKIESNFVVTPWRVWGHSWDTFWALMEHFLGTLGAFGMLLGNFGHSLEGP